MIAILLLLILLVLLLGSGAVLTGLGIAAAILVVLSIIGLVGRALFGDWDEIEARRAQAGAEEWPPAKQRAAGKRAAGKRAAALREEEALLHWYEFATGAVKENAVDKDLAQALLRLHRAKALLRLYKRKYRLSIWNQWALESLWKAIADAGDLAPDSSEIPHGAIVVGIELWRHCFMDLADRNKLMFSAAQQKFQDSQRRLEHLGVIGIRNNIAWLNGVLKLRHTPPRPTSHQRLRSRHAKRSKSTHPDNPNQSARRTSVGSQSGSRDCRSGPQEIA